MSIPSERVNIANPVDKLEKTKTKYFLREIPTHASHMAKTEKNQYVGSLKTSDAYSTNRGCTT